MKQIFQDIKSGETLVEEVPLPAAGPGQVLIDSRKSLVSAGTERMLVEFGRSGYLGKARQQPDKVKAVLDKIATDGLLQTIEAVKAKLDQPLAMGYSNVGVVADVGEGVTGLQVGDRVVSNGHHADFVVVNENLCARIPDGVDDDTAAFTVVGAIALQGIRLLKPTLGERFVVVGLGLIGLLAVQILRANGCRVLGIDIDKSKLERAAALDAEVVEPDGNLDNLQTADLFSAGKGVDGVLIAASSKSDEIVHEAATMCRKRGRIVLVGVVGLSLRRADFYEKELSFQVSCSYGPGRYDPSYEAEGHDYPLPYVRWTEQRNFEAVLDLMQGGRVVTRDLVSATFTLSDAAGAYKLLQESPSTMGVLIDYGSDDRPGEKGERTIALVPIPDRHRDAATVVIGAIGAGNYASRVLLPGFAKTGARFRTIVTLGGASATRTGKRLGFEQASTDVAQVFEDDAINFVVIATRHDSHAKFVEQALRAGKDVFVEKPLAMTNQELDAICSAYDEQKRIGRESRLMVGFNRRFAPYVQEVKSRLSDVPLSLVYTCNAGQVDKDSWVHDPAKGGGRILGEACHFVDLARFLAASRIVDIGVNVLTPTKGVADTRDTATLNLTFENGSIASLHYFANGNASFPKERFEVFQAGDVCTVDNFRSFRSYGSRPQRKKSFRMDKGQDACCAAIVAAIKQGEPAPIPFEELIEVSKAAIEAADLASL